MRRRSQCVRQFLHGVRPLQSGCFDTFLSCSRQVEILCPPPPKTFDPFQECINLVRHQPAYDEFVDSRLDRAEFLAVTVALTGNLCDEAPLYLMEYLFAPLAAASACVPCADDPDTECCTGQDLLIPLFTEEDVTNVCGTINFIIQAECAKTNQFCIPEQVPSCVASQEACAPDCSLSTTSDDTTTCLLDCFSPATECINTCLGVTASNSNSPGTVTETLGNSSGIKHTGEPMLLTIGCWVGAAIFWTML